VRCSGQLS